MDIHHLPGNPGRLWREKGQGDSSRPGDNFACFISPVFKGSWSERCSSITSEGLDGGLHDPPRAGMFAGQFPLPALDGEEREDHLVVVV